MGGKSAGTRHYLLLCFTFLVFGSSCSIFDFQRPPAPKPTPSPVIIERLVPSPEPPRPPTEPKVHREIREADNHLQFAQQLLGKGDYEGSLRESQKVIALAKDSSPADAAVFNMGLVHAHPNNPKKDNKRAIEYFNRLIKGYPGSPWVDQAKIWVGVLDGVEKLKQVDIEIEEKKRDQTR